MHLGMFTSISSQARRGNFGIPTSPKKIVHSPPPQEAFVLVLPRTVEAFRLSHHRCLWQVWRMSICLGRLFWFLRNMALPIVMITWICNGIRQTSTTINLTTTVATLLGSTANSKDDRRKDILIREKLVYTTKLPGLKSKAPALNFGSKISGDMTKPVSSCLRSSTCVEMKKHRNISLKNYIL